MFTAAPTTVWPDFFCCRCPMRVVIPPVVVEARICRIIAAVDSLLEVEEWAGAWWLPSTVPLSTASAAPQASQQLLAAAGVPEADWYGTMPRPDEHAIEAQLRAAEPERRGTQRIEDEVFVRIPQTWPRSYPGNVRFRRGTLSPTDRGFTGPDRRRGDASSTWHGPWRRRTDLPDEPLR